MSAVPLGGVLGALNHLLAAIVEEHADNHGPGLLSISSIMLIETSVRVTGVIRVKDHSEPFIVRCDVQPPDGAKQKLVVIMEQWPARLPAMVSWLKPLLEESRVTLDLDFEKLVPPPGHDS